MAGRLVSVTDEREPYEALNVQIKIGGVDLNGLKSRGKLIHLAGREYPMSRFGTWVLHKLPAQDDVNTLLTQGGIAVGIVWGLLQCYSEVLVWVDNLYECIFTLEAKKSEKKRILNEIGNGTMARNVEDALRELKEIDVYKRVRVKLIKLIREKTPEKGKRNYGDIDDQATERIKKLSEAETVANLMNINNFSWAFLILKQSLQDEKDDVFRLQMLMRLSICSLQLKNYGEMVSSLAEIIRLMKKVNIPADQIASYECDYRTLHALLMESGSAIRSIELSFVFNEIAKKCSDPNQRIDKICINLNHACQAMQALLSIEPGACLKCQLVEYMKKIDEELAFLKRQTGGDPLVHSQCVYYAEFNAAQVRLLIGTQMKEVFRESSHTFKRIGSIWGDLPFVVTRLKLHPEVSKYMDDREFVQSVKEICRKPALLQEKIKNPKIAHANEILMSEFGIFTDANDIKSAFEENNIAPEGLNATGFSSKKKKEVRPVDKKLEAQKEKEKGNDAYKKKEFEKAHSHYGKAISLDPDNALLHWNKAAVYISQEKLEQAKTSCLFAINLAQNSDRHGDKDVAKILARLARVEFLGNHLDIALALYQRSLRMNVDVKVQEQMKECEEKILAIRFMSSMRFPF